MLACMSTQHIQDNHISQSMVYLFIHFKVRIFKSLKTNQGLKKVGNSNLKAQTPNFKTNIIKNLQF